MSDFLLLTWNLFHFKTEPSFVDCISDKERISNERIYANDELNYEFDDDDDKEEDNCMME